jgi:glycosyltransferase involved in cell wall biosynthesis
MQQSRKSTAGSYDVSIIVSTYERCELLAEALESILTQDDSPPYEVIVVDNNSTDRTSELVTAVAKSAANKVRYLFEPRQGVSYARNTGILKARAPIIAFFDDDVRVSRNWVATIRKTFEENPEIDCIGGPVFPLWESEPPTWLTRRHWAPLALQDYGDREFPVDQDNRLCLLSANLAFRRAALDRTGLFAHELQRVKGGIGSMEDLELLHRFWRMSLKALYVPELSAVTTVPAERMTRSYHRRWHSGHGRFYAMLRADEMERSRAGTLLGVPAHLYRQGLVSAYRWVRDTLLFNRSRAFESETRLRFFAGFFSRRLSEFMKLRRRNPANSHATVHQADPR